MTCFPASTCFSISCTPQRHHATTLLSGGRCAMHSHARAQPSAAPHKREIASHRRTFVSTTGEGYEKGRLHYNTHSGSMIVLFFGSGGAEDARLDAARDRSARAAAGRGEEGDQGGRLHHRRARQAAFLAILRRGRSQIAVALARRALSVALLPKRMRRPASLVVGATCSCLGFL